MYVKIKTNGAHTIVIHVPHEGSDQSLPALAKMFEENAVFVSSPGWHDNAIVEPEMTIHLGSQCTLKSKNDEILFTEHRDPSAVISSEWIPCTPQVLVSNAARVRELEHQISSYVKEIDALKYQLEQVTQAEEA